jgi:hypothetical protein
MMQLIAGGNVYYYILEQNTDRLFPYASEDSINDLLTSVSNQDPKPQMAIALLLLNKYGMKTAGDYVLEIIGGKIV